MTSSPSHNALRSKAEIVECTDLAPAHPEHFRLALHAPEIAAKARPGQFIHVLPPSSELMLRRPFSILSADPNQGRITFLFKVIGEGTRLISGAESGEPLDVIGPLGNGFPIKTDHRAFLVGAGVGIPPLNFLFNTLRPKRVSRAPSAQIGVQSLLAARGKTQFVCIDIFRANGIDPGSEGLQLLLAVCEPDIYRDRGTEPFLVTEDGSVGELGIITDFLDSVSKTLVPKAPTAYLQGYQPAHERLRLLNAPGAPKTIVYSCGPVPMLKAVANWASNRQLTHYASLESKLACGFGACLGCSIPVRDKVGGIRYERVCCDGPVFDATRIAFDLM